MNYELVVKEEADRDILEAYDWYEQKQSGLGESFLKEVEWYLGIIKSNPKLYAIRNKNRRAAVLRRFPYIIVYEHDEQRIIVLSVFNTSQNPRKWIERK
jgi:plasmid stabilization system protein ParE